MSSTLGSNVHNHSTGESTRVPHSSYTYMYIQPLNRWSTVCIHATTYTTQCCAGASRHRIRQLEAEAAERDRVEREGVVVLRLRMADLFAEQDSIVSKLDTPVANIRGKYMYMYT